MARSSTHGAILKYIHMRSEGKDDSELMSALLGMYASTLVDAGLEAIQDELQAYYSERKKDKLTKT